MIKKYLGKTLYRIRALVTIAGVVSSGSLGGYIEKESNLSHCENAWIFGNARIYGDAQISGNARIYGDAWIYGDAQIEKTIHYMNISQLKFNLTITPRNISGGCRLFTHKEFRELTLDKCQSDWKEGELENYKALQEIYWKQFEIYDPILKLLLEKENEN